MLFLADENTAAGLVVSMRENGFSVVYIKETTPGIDDQSVLDKANSLGAVLITEDKDFGELVYRMKLAHHGVILIRLSGLGQEEKKQYLVDVLTEYQSEFTDAFTVISEDKIRIRRGNQI